MLLTSMISFIKFYLSILREKTQLQIFLPIPINIPKDRGKFRLSKYSFADLLHLQSFVIILQTSKRYPLRKLGYKHKKVNHIHLRL